MEFQRRERIHSVERNHRKLNGPGDMEGNSKRMGTSGDWGRAARQRVTVRGSGSFLRLKVTVVALFLHSEYSYIPIKNTAIFQCFLSFRILKSLQSQQKLLGELKEFTVWWDGCGPILTAVGVVPYDVVSAAPVPEQQGGIARPRHDVAVPADVRLRPGQARHHIPVAKYNLS